MPDGKCMCGRTSPCNFGASEKLCYYNSTAWTPPTPLPRNAGLGAVAALILYTAIHGTNSNNGGDYASMPDSMVYKVSEDVPLYDYNKKQIAILEAGSCAIRLGVGKKDTVVEGHWYFEMRTPYRFEGFVFETDARYQPDRGSEGCTATISTDNFSIYKVFNDSTLYYGATSDSAVSEIYLPAGTCIMVDESQPADGGKIRTFVESSDEDYASSYVSPLYINQDNTRPMGVFDLDCLGSYFSWSVVPGISQELKPAELGAAGPVIAP